MRSLLVGLRTSIMHVSRRYQHSNGGSGPSAREEFAFAAVLAADGRVVQVSNAALVMGGVQREEVLGQPLWETVWLRGLSAGPQTWLDRLARARLARAPLVVQEHLRSGGELRTAKLAVSACDVCEGCPAFYFVEAVDIRQMRRTLCELKDAQSILSKVQRIDQLGSWSWDAKADTVSWSPETCRIFGLAEGEFDGRYATFLAMIHPQDRDRVEQAVGRAFAGAKRYTYRYRFLRKDGQMRLAEGEAESEVDHANRLVRLVGTVRDITERESERQALHASESKLQTLAALSSDWQWEQDEQFRFTAFSGGRPNSASKVRSDLVGKTRWDMPATPLQGTWEDHRAALEQRQTFLDFEYSLGDGPATRYISVSGAPMFDDAGRFNGYRGTAVDITEHKRAGEELSQSRSMLAMAMRLGRLGGWTLELPERRVTWTDAGRAAQEMGWSAGSDPRHLLELIDAEWRGQVRQAMQDCIEKGEPLDVEVRVCPPGRKAMWVRIIGEAQRADNGRVLRVRGVVQDVTQRRQADEQSRALASRLVATLESISDSFYTLGRDWRFTYVNQQAERDLRLPRDELLGRIVWEVFPAAVGTEFQKRFESALALGRSVEFEEFYAPFEKWFRVKAYPSSEGLAVHFRDVTDVRCAQNAVLDSREQFQQLFENTIDGVLYCLPDGQITKANAAACALLHMSETEICRAGRSGIVAPDDQGLALIIDQRTRTGSGCGQVTIVRSDGVRLEVEMGSAQYRARDGSVRVFIVFRDITDRVRAQQEIVTLNAELAERVRQRTTELELANADLRAFAHSLAHDLRSPIAAINGFSEMLERSLPSLLSERSRHYLARIRNAGRRMDAYTDGLLSLARVSEAPMTVCTVDLTGIVGEILQQLQEQEPQRCVRARVQEGLRVWGDSSLLRMALDNLIGNAWKFTGRRDCAEIDLIAHDDGDGRIVYEVSDNGAGFDMAYAEKLFCNFQRLHAESDFPGTGIGLVNVQRIMSRHGGRVWAQAVEGKGASFFFTLWEPKVGSEQGAPQGAAGALLARDGHKPTEAKSVYPANS